LSGVAVALSGVTSGLKVGVAVAVTRVAAKVVRSTVAEERARRSSARVLAGDGRGGIVQKHFTLPVWASHQGRGACCSMA
jgi:hypothetical protein